MREVLHRELYRGVIVWNQTRKRDRWGKQDQRPRPQAEWLRVPDARAPDRLRLTCGRAPMHNSRRARHQYSQIGKPVDGEASARGRIRRDTDAAHLLTGLARCATCGGGMSVHKRQHGGQLVPLYGCLSHWKRGPSICANRLLGRPDTVDAEVLATLQDDIMRPRVIEEAIRIAMAELAPARQTVNRRRLAAELTTVRAECERLADAIARGGPLDVLVERLQERQARRVVIEGELAAERSMASHTSPAALEQRLRAKLADWRGLLTRNVSEGRAVLRTLLVGPLRFTPIDEERRRGYAFEGMIALDRLLSGVVDLPPVVRPQRERTDVGR